MGKSRAGHKKLSSMKVLALQRMYAKTKSPSNEDMQSLSMKTGLPMTQIQFWFESKRNADLKEKVIQQRSEGPATPNEIESIAEKTGVTKTRVKYWLESRESNEKKRQFREALRTAKEDRDHSRSMLDISADKSVQETIGVHNSKNYSEQNGLRIPDFIYQNDFFLTCRRYTTYTRRIRPEVAKCNARLDDNGKAEFLLILYQEFMAVNPYRDEAKYGSYRASKLTRSMSQNSCGHSSDSAHELMDTVAGRRSPLVVNERQRSLTSSPSAQLDLQPLAHHEKQGELRCSNKRTHCIHKDSRSYLEQMFETNALPTFEEMTRIALKTNLPFTTVKNWYMNRRAKTKRSKSEGYHALRTPKEISNDFEIRGILRDQGSWPLINESTIAELHLPDFVYSDEFCMQVTHFPAFCQEMAARVQAVNDTVPEDKVTKLISAMYKDFTVYNPYIDSNGRKPTRPQHMTRSERMSPVKTEAEFKSLSIEDLLRGPKFTRSLSCEPTVTVTVPAPSSDDAFYQPPTPYTIPPPPQLQPVPEIPNTVKSETNEKRNPSNNSTVSGDSDRWSPTVKIESCEPSNTDSSDDVFGSETVKLEAQPNGSGWKSDREFRQSIHSEIREELVELPDCVVDTLRWEQELFESAVSLAEYVSKYNEYMSVIRVHKHQYGV